MSSLPSTQPQQRSNINISSSLSTTTTTTTSSHHLLQQRYEMQPTRPSVNRTTWDDMYAMNQREQKFGQSNGCIQLTQVRREAMQERNGQIDIRPGETQHEVLRRVLLEFGLPPHLLHEVRSSGQDARAARAGADTFVLRNLATQELTEVLFDQASSGVTHNVAIRSQQFNTAMGPGSRVSRNHATDSLQKNCAVCTVM